MNLKTEKEGFVSKKAQTHKPHFFNNLYEQLKGFILKTQSQEIYLYLDAQKHEDLRTVGGWKPSWILELYDGQLFSALYFKGEPLMI